jgi:excinuclease UvrABC nuclease subunit
LDDYQRYYVYTHRDPITQEVVYVGRGRRDRAWQCRSSQRMFPAHVEWLEKKLDDGWLTMDDIVTIEAKGMWKEDATLIENELIEKHKPPFNRKLGIPFKLIDEQAWEARAFYYEGGWSYKELAEKYGVSTMTMWRAINRG